MAPSPDPAPGAETMSHASLANRKGYDERFLGPVVPLPVPSDPAIETVVLPCTPSVWCSVLTGDWPHQQQS
jgi:endonuclease G